MRFLALGLALIPLALLGGCSATGTAPAPANAPRVGPVAQINQQVDTLRVRLDLTPEQVDRVRPIVASHLRRVRQSLGYRVVTPPDRVRRERDRYGRVRETRQSRSPQAQYDRTPEEAQDELDALQRETDAQMEAVLTAEQYARYLVWRDEQRAALDLPPLDAEPASGTPEGDGGR